MLEFVRKLKKKIVTREVTWWLYDTGAVL